MDGLTMEAFMEKVYELFSDKAIIDENIKGELTIDTGLELTGDGLVRKIENL